MIENEKIKLNSVYIKTKNICNLNMFVYLFMYKLVLIYEIFYILFTNLKEKKKEANGCDGHGKWVDKPLQLVET